MARLACRWLSCVASTVLAIPRTTSGRASTRACRCPNLCELEAENVKFKRMYADLTQENTAIKDVKPKILTPSAKCEVIEQLVQTILSITSDLSDCWPVVGGVLQKAGLASERDAEVINARNAIVTRHGCRGFWKCFARLRLDGRCWNKKRVYRVYLIWV